MRMCFRFLHRIFALRGWIAALVFLPVCAVGQTAVCPAIAEHALTPAETAYGEGNYKKAEDLFGAAVAQQPHDLALSVAYVHTLLHNDEVEQASAQVNKSLAEDPHSAIVLTALAEVQLGQGQPWLAVETLNTAAASDACYARIHLIRSRALRLDSMYGSERAEIQKAYDINPNDPDIRHAWLSVVSPSHEIEGIDKALGTMKDIDAETRRKAEESMRSMMTLLWENTQTCQVLPTVPSATLPLQVAMRDSKHVDGYRLEVKFPQSAARLIVDTAASGMFISKTVAEKNGLEPRSGDPPGTVHVDNVQIGPLEFHDCMVGVSDAPFGNKGDGFISTDMFASYLITLDHPAAKLMLEPLPPQAEYLVGNRSTVPELRDFTPVYHRRQYLLVPVTLNNKTRKLFVLDSGIRLSTMTPEVAHSVSSTKINFTNPIQIVSGGTAQIYRDSFDFQYANLSLNHQAGILEFDPETIDQNAGFKIAGMLGFDMLHLFSIHLDYRDGLVKFDSTNADISPGVGHGGESLTASDNVACPAGDTKERPITSTIEAKVMGSPDSGHLKPGKEILAKVVHGWIEPGCTLSDGAVLYGRVTAASTIKSAGKSELGMVFDHGDCDGHDKKELALRVIGVVAAPGSFVGLQSAVPSEVRGGARDVSATGGIVASFALTVNLNPEGPPHTVHPGIVLGMPGVALTPAGGPGCSDILRSSDHSVRISEGAELILTRESSASN